jgi:hypothetical protein
MLIFGGLIGAIIFVTLGYFAFWTVTRQGTPHYIANFGKIMGIILFVVAGLVLIFSMSGGIWRGKAMGCGMFSGPFKGWGKGKMGMTWTDQKDLQQQIDELNDRVDDLEQRVNEMPVFVQDMVKSNIERLQKEGKK